MTDQFLSVPTVLRAMFRRADSPESPRLYKGAMPSSTAGLREEMLSSARQNDMTLRFLAEMDRKLDAILGLLQRESLSVEFPHEAHVVELSASGLTLESAVPLAPGDCMELLLLLEEYPTRTVSVLARIDSVLERRALTGPPNKAYAVQYASIEQEEREHIIRYVFSEERKRIRQQKNDL